MLAVPHCVRDLSSPTRGRTRALCNGNSAVPTMGLPEITLITDDLSLSYYTVISTRARVDVFLALSLLDLSTVPGT